MKKWLKFYFIFAILFIISGCDSSSNQDEIITYPDKTNPNPPISPPIEKNYFKLSQNINPKDSGTIIIEPNLAEYEAGTKVKITAQPNTGFNFASWSGASTSNMASIEITMDTDIALVANFESQGEWISHVLPKPDNIDKLFTPIEAPVVNGLTSHVNETMPTVISQYQEYEVNNDFKITMGKLNHAKDEKILSMEFKVGNGLSIIPIERSTGQFSKETTTKSMDYRLAQGDNILGAINADPFNMFNGWAVGITTIDGVNYTGTNISYNDKSSNVSAVVIKTDGTAKIIPKADVPLFTLRAYQNGSFLSDVRTGYYFDNENNTNKFKFFANSGGGNLAVYSADNYQGPISISQTKSAVLVKPSVNGVTVIEKADGSTAVQYPPFNSKVIRTITAADSPFTIPSGHALIVSDTAAPLNSLQINDNLDLKLETDDPIWQDVKHALGGGFTTGLLVKDGQLADDNNQTNISSRSALGIKSDGTIFFLTVDKVKGSPSDGITLRKLGQIMLGYGAVDAIQLDGGGSTSLAYRLPTMTSSSAYALNNPPKSLLLNTPSDGNERPVATKWGIKLDSGNSYTNKIHLFPKEVHLLAGTEFRGFTLIGYDGEFNSLTGQTNLGISDASLGLVHQSDLAFRAGYQTAEGYIYASIGEEITASKVFIYDAIDTITFASDNLILNPSEKVNLLPVLMKNNKQLSYLPSQLTYTLDNQNAGTIDKSTGLFTASPSLGGKAVLTVKYGNKETQINLQVGQPPIIFEDFEGNTSVYKSGGSRTKSHKIEISDAYKFAGDKGLKLTWQGDTTQAGTLAAELIATPQTIKIEDYPKRIGLNIYIPEELVGKKVWLRSQYRDADNKTIALDYTSDAILQNSGWQFLNVAFPTGYKAPIYLDKPLRFLVTKNDDRVGTDSYLYLDNFMAIYSDNIDFNGPEVVVSPAENDVLNISNPLITIVANDSSEVNPESINLKLDGSPLPASSYQFDNIKTITYQTNNLGDGYHKIEYSISDKAGNTTTGEQLFGINTGKARIYIDDSNVEFYAGSKALIPIKVMNGETFQKFNIEIQSNNKLHTKDIKGQDLLIENKQITNELISASFNGFSQSTSTIGYIELNINDTVNNGDIKLFISGQVDNKPFYHPVINKQINGLYQLENTYITTNGTNEVQVLDINKQPVSGVDIEVLRLDSLGNVVSSEIIGTTDSYGRITYALDCTTSCDQNLIMRIKGAQGSSKLITIPILGERLTSNPSFIYLTPGKDYQSMNVTWYTNTTADDFTVYYGNNGLSSSANATSELIPFYFNPKPGLVKVHHAKLTGLVADSLYSYKIINIDGETEVFSFKTARNDNTVKLHILGDTQTLDSDTITGGSPLIGELLNKMDVQLPNKDLIIHVGDFTDDITLYSLVERFMKQITGTTRASSVPLIMAQGNHEVYNEGAIKFGQMFSYDIDNNLNNQISKAVYSIDYNNLHLAVITAEVFDDATWQSMVEWLRSDMNNSDKQWKIILSHRPPYEANPGSGNGFVKKYLPSLVDELKIDLVLSGHDHIYSRSKPVKNGQLDNSGTTYLIAGSASAKFYDAGTGGIVPFKDVLYDTNKHTYTTIEINANQLEIHTKTIDGELLDKHILSK